jgi:hypothetical protein
VSVIDLLQGRNNANAITVATTAVLTVSFTVHRACAKITEPPPAAAAPVI